MEGFASELDVSGAAFVEETGAGADVSGGAFVKEAGAGAGVSGGAFVKEIGVGADIAGGAFVVTVIWAGLVPPVISAGLVTEPVVPVFGAALTGAWGCPWTGAPPLSFGP